MFVNLQQQDVSITEYLTCCFLLPVCCSQGFNYEGGEGEASQCVVVQCVVVRVSTTREEREKLPSVW